MPSCENLVKDSPLNLANLALSMSENTGLIIFSHSLYIGLNRLVGKFFCNQNFVSFSVGIFASIYKCLKK